MTPTLILVTLIIVSLIPSSESAFSMAQAENSDRLTFWKDRWVDNKIGWHESDVNEALQKYGELFIPNLLNADASVCTNPVRVFVPLCGKTVDMAYLASNPAVSQVVGVDGILKALETFAEEQPRLEIKRSVVPTDDDDDDTDKYDRLKGTKIELLRGDFFELDATHTAGRFDVIFDRASLVAIDPSLREKYVAVMGQLLQRAGKIFLVTVERNSGDPEFDAKAGPPFSVPEAEVRRLYEGQDWVESVTLLDGNGEQKRNAGTGMVSLYFSIQGKA